MNAAQLRTKLERLKGQYNQIENDIKSNKKKVKSFKKDLIKHEQAKEIIREVGIKTQEQLQYHISDITSMALETVFDDPYELKIEFVQRRNKTECDIYFERNGEKSDPVSSSGGGAVDVAAFALQIASWSLKNPNPRNTIILDEPMKWVSGKYLDKASNMLKEVGQRLGIQFIIITHKPQLAVYGDKVFEVTNKKGISTISSKATF